MTASHVYAPAGPAEAAASKHLTDVAPVTERVRTAEFTPNVQHSDRPRGSLAAAVVAAERAEHGPRAPPKLP